MPQQRRILQIIPATGWEAIYNNPNRDEALLMFSSPLVCWALVEYEDGRQGVEGMHAMDYQAKGAAFCEDQPLFRCYQTIEDPDGPGLEELLADERHSMPPPSEDLANGH